MEREFLDKLFEVIRNFAEYGKYQGKIEKAVASISKSYPTIPKEELNELFEHCVRAYQEAVILVKQNISHYSSSEKTELPAETTFRKKYSMVPSEILNWSIGWIYHWHWER